MKKIQQEVEAKSSPQASAPRIDSEILACYDLSVFPKGASTSMVVLGLENPQSVEPGGQNMTLKRDPRDQLEAFSLS